VADFPALQWDDESGTPKIGDGISRPVPGAKTREYKVRVSQVGASPMYVHMRAETKTSAIKYAKARWPNAEVSVVS
jgi:hypothetical protein